MVELDWSSHGCTYTRFFYKLLPLATGAPTNSFHLLALSSRLFVTMEPDPQQIKKVAKKKAEFL